MAASPLIGQVLGGTYRVERLLGQGGMGAVYAAVHLRLPMRVAIKVLHGEAAQNPEIFARFRREAEIASGLRHPNIVQVFDFNHLEDGTPYLIMEFLEGEDLAVRLRQRGRLSYPETQTLCQAVGSGLSAAHRRDVVHRDLKPQNIFLARHEQGDGIVEIPKIVDFGISKIRHAVVESFKTRDQQLLGTPNYMSPEQARGLNSEVDHRTDQWALAAILFQCLTGQLAFAGDTLAAIIYAVVLSEPPPLRSLAPEVPAHAGEAIARAMSKERDRRFGTIMDFVRAFCGMPQLAAASPLLSSGEPLTRAPLIPTPPALVAPAAGSNAHPLVDARMRDSLTGAGGQMVPPAGGRRRLVLALLGGTLGAMAAAAMLILGVRSAPLRSPTPPDFASSSSVVDLLPPAPRDLALPAEVGRKGTPPPAPRTTTDEATRLRQTRQRGKDHDRELRPRSRIPRSDADDVDITGIR